MKTYAINVWGWLMVVEAKDARQALTLGKQSASSASLLPNDVQLGHVRLATDADLAQYEAMGGVR